MFGSFQACGQIHVDWTVLLPLRIRKSTIAEQERERERERERGAVNMKIITPEKIVPYKCCLLSLNISVKMDFDMDFLFNSSLLFNVVMFIVMFTEYG